MTRLPLLALLVAAPAWADDLFVLENASGEPIWLLEPIPGHWTERTGFGNPTVIYDKFNSRYVMYFESRLYDEWLFNSPTASPAGLGLNPRDYDDCRLGRDPAKPAIVWAIGRATSPDGFSWTVDPWPVIRPAPHTWYACQVAQPAAMYVHPNQWHLYFKAVQWNPSESSPGWVGPCDGGTTPVGGCAPVTGFGYAHAVNTDGSTLNVQGLALRSDAIEALTGVPPHQIGFPRVSAINRDVFLWYTAVPRVYQAIASLPRGPFVTGAAPITDFPGAADGRLKTGAVYCRNGVPPASMIDGIDHADEVACGLSVVASPDLRTWQRKSEDLLMTWDCESGWDRWEAFDVGPDVILWYAAKERALSSAPRRIGFAATVPLATQPPYALLQPALFGTKSCKKAPVLSTPLATWSTSLEPVVATQAVAEPPGTPTTGCECHAVPGPVGATPLPLILLWLARRRAPSRRT